MTNPATAPVPTPATGQRPGYRTTEFWLVVATSLGAVISAAADWLPPRYAALAAAAASGLYAIGRGLSKVNPPK